MAQNLLLEMDFEMYLKMAYILIIIIVKSS